MTALQSWNAEDYDAKFAFNWILGDGTFQLLSPAPNERILDIGCGTGALTGRISEAGAQVVGIDFSAEMVSKASASYPSLDFRVMDAHQLVFEEEFDAVFSNAALHWMPKPNQVAEGIYRSLKPGGRFVAEFGGDGNVRQILHSLDTALKSIDPRGIARAVPWYFPSIVEYAAVLRDAGLELVYARLFDRPTVLEAGADGFRDWLKMFGSRFLEGLSETECDAVMTHAEQSARPHLWQGDHWIADYRRIQVMALKPLVQE